MFQAAPFPAVTVCNLNPYKHSLVQGIDEIAKSVRLDDIISCYKLVV